MTNSCKSAKNAANTKPTLTSQQIIKNVIIDKNFDLINYKKEFAIKSTTIADSTLSISFSYIGCNNDDFDQIFNKNHLKSYPIKASLNQIKKSNGKDYGKQMEKTLFFNISPVQYPSVKNTFFFNFQPTNKN